MTSSDQTIVICGATGRQGGAVPDALLRSGASNLVALSRDPDGERAHAIRRRGVEVRQADLRDRDALSDAFTGAYGVYRVTTPMTPKGKFDIEAERAQGVTIADACVASGIEHLVMSTVLHIDDEQEAVPYVRSKRWIERSVMDRGIPSTFLCPGPFMDEIGGEFLPVKKGVLTGQADDDAKIPYVACRDIGEFAAMAFADPASFVGTKLNLVGDFVSGDELAQTLSRVSGRPVRHKAPPIWLMWIFARQWITLRKQFESWGRPPYPDAMMQALEESHRLRPEMLTFEQYLRATEFTA